MKDSTQQNPLDGLNYIPSHMEGVVPYATAEALPTDIDAYRHRSHFLDMKSCRRDPPITDDIIESVLEDGKIELHDDDDPFAYNSKRRVIKDIDGTSWVVVVAVFRKSQKYPDASDSFDLLTAFCEEHEHIHLNYEHEGDAEFEYRPDF